MTQQPSTPNRPVALATFFLVVAVGVFGIAFYVLDGVALVRNLIVSRTQNVVPVTPASRAAGTAKLSLPAGMSQEFALRVWQEQVDSQVMITRLIKGDLTSLTLDRVTRQGNMARIHITARDANGSKATGVLEFTRLGANWYTSKVTLMPRVIDPPSLTPLPTMADVDVKMLNTMLDQNLKSQAVIGEYIDGTVRRLEIQKLTPGINTVTLRMLMIEKSSKTYANLVAIREDVDGEELWMLARFTKTAEEPNKP